MVINVQSNQNSQDTQKVSGDQLRGITDSKLSLGAVGMWSYICEIIGDRDFTLEELQQAKPNMNEDDVADYYWELVDAGYIED